LGISLAALYSTGRLGNINVAEVEAPPEAIANAGHGGQPNERVEKPVKPLDNPFDPAPFGAEDLAASLQRGVPWQVPYAIEPQASDKVVAFVDEELARGWASAGVQPTAAIDDEQWAERVTEQLLGRAPSLEELQAFRSDNAPDKRERLVQRLLYEDGYRGEFARHWASVWSRELIGGSASPAQREGLQQYLAKSLADEKPFSQITHELLTATGSNDPRAEDYNAATNFVLSGASGKREALAATVGRVFLGHQGQCAQCHDAAGGQGMSQQQFWQIAAFFQQARPQRLPAGTTRLVDADYVGQTGDADEAELFYDRADQQRKIAYPVFIDGQAISPSGRVAEVNRRQELARLLVSSEAFSKATVNQWWSHLLGRGLAPAADTASEHQHNLELQRRLAEQFAAHGFDQKQLVSWIVLSQANALSAGETNSRQLATAPLFDRFYGDAQREAVYDSFVAALDAAQRGARPLDPDYRALLARVAPVRPADDGSASIIARSAGSLRRLQPSEYTFVDRMIASDMTFADKVKHLFLSGTGRAPTEAELQAAQDTLARYEGSVAGALEELWWAIENSSEYQN
jgi:hypothetical protein